MKAEIYSHTDPSGEPKLMGTIPVENGVAIIPPELAYVGRTNIVEPGSLDLLHPTHGDRYIEALPYTFRATGYSSVKIVR